ncbi:MAG: hypothetical protein K6T88_06370 [Bacillus sp. (in: Bacteria)]|nr:hypothetical protein [Bacillus sp. (in: firmicutes)]
MKLLNFFEPLQEDLKYLINTNGKELLIKTDFKFNPETNQYELVATQKPVLITNKKSSGYYDEKYIHTYEEIKTGTYIEIEEYGTKNFVVINEVAKSKYGLEYEYVYKGIIRSCPFTIKHQWADQGYGAGQLTEFPCYFIGQGYQLTSTQLINFITTSELFVYLQNNEYTNGLQEGTRFIKFNKAWKVYGIDKTQGGILTWYCKQDAIDFEHDDLMNEIAYNV